MLTISLNKEWGYFFKESQVNDREDIYNKIKDEWYIFEQGNDSINHNYLQVISNNELREKIYTNENWLKVSRLYLDYIEQTLKFSSPSYAIIITDKDGYCIEVRCNEDIKNSQKENYVILGISYSEINFRSNAIGMAIRMKRPVLAKGAEHQRILLRKWSCISVPIIGNKKNLYGVFNILVPNNSLKLFYLSLASSVVRNIESELDEIPQEYSSQNLLPRNDDINLEQAFDKQFSFLWHNMTQGIIVMGYDYKIKFINPAARRLLHAVRDCINKSIFEISHYISGEELGLVKTLKQLERTTNEIAIDVNGEELCLLVDTDILYDNQGNILGASAILSDLTDMYRAKKKEKQAKQIEDELIWGILNSLPVGVIAYSNEKTIAFVNKAFELLTGFEKLELIDLTIPKISTILDLCNSNNNLIISEQVLEAKRPEMAYRGTVCQKNGKKIEVFFSSIPVQENSHGIAALTIAQDKSLENSFEHFWGYSKSILQCMQSGVIAFDAKHYKINMLNKEAEEILGITVEEVMGMPFKKAFPGMALELTEIAEQLNNYKEPIKSKILNINTERGMKKILLNAELVSSNRGNVLGVVIVFNDITNK